MNYDELLEQMDYWRDVLKWPDVESGQLDDIRRTLGAAAEAIRSFRQ